MTETEDRAPNSGKYQLFMLVGIALLATLVPYLMYYTGWAVPSATSNNGILVQDPIIMTDFDFRDHDGRVWSLAEQEPKFRLLIPVYGECSDACQETLYLTRQVRRRLSEKSDQLQRIYVQLDGQYTAEFGGFLTEEHRDVLYLSGDYDQWKSEVGARAELQDEFAGDEYYLLHRYGALGLAYNNQHSGNQLLDDLEFLIRTSN